MQGKLVLPKAGNWGDKVASAAHFAGVDVVDSYVLIDDHVFELKAKNFEGAVKFGRYLEKVDGTELKAAKDRQAKKEAANKRA